MTELNPISDENGLICKNCKGIFTLGISSQLIFGERLTFPNGDLSLIRAQCPQCHTASTYNNSEMLVPQTQIDSNILNKRISQYEKRIGDLMADNQEKTQTIKTKDEQISELLKANNKLADGIDRLTQILVNAGIMPQPENQKPPTPKVPSTLSDGTG